MKAPVLTAAAAVAGCVVLAPGAGVAQGPAANERGRAVYVKWCAGCHGDDGGGGGPAARHLLPKPRDFTLGIYQIRTTATGELPTDADLRRVLDEGMPGTSMPGWRGVLSARDRAAVIEYLKSLSPDFAGEAPRPLDFGRDPGGGRAAVDSGRALYQSIECWRCHGNAGRGDGPSAPTLKDDQGTPIRATNLTQNWTFNGGPQARDIHRTLRTGLDGTPMPTFGDLIDANLASDADLWRVAHYVRSLSPRTPPRVRDVVQAALVEGALPDGPDDEAWADFEPFWVPLVGQIMVKPRWFAPTVNGVWVQAAHNGSDLALRVVWHDPSRSPDRSWDEWRVRVAQHMAHDDSAAAFDLGPLPDRLVVQFPRQVPRGLDRPYFLGGSPEQPVYLWLWESVPSGGAGVEALGRGLDAVTPLAPPAELLRSAAVWEDGEWRVQFTRPLAAGEAADRLEFVTGRSIPMAFFAWDGSNGEAGTRGAVSSWVSIHLAGPGRAGTIVWPLFAMLATAGLGIVVIVRAQRAAGALGRVIGEATETAEAV